MKKEHSNTVIIIAVVALVIMILIMMAPNISIGASSGNSGFMNPFSGGGVVFQQPPPTPLSSVIVAPPVQQPANVEPSQTQNLSNEPNFTGGWGNPNAPQLNYQ